jgi:hypothetical protein
MCYLFVYFTCLKKKTVQISTGTTVQISTGTWTRFNQWKFIYMASADDQMNIKKKKHVALSRKPRNLISVW